MFSCDGALSMGLCNYNSNCSTFTNKQAQFVASNKKEQIEV